jgi:ATP-binding cassette subfamily F protein uup
VLGLDGRGDAERFADYSQWEEWQRASRSREAAAASRVTCASGASAASAAPAVEVEAPRPVTPRKKLSYKEAREFASMEKNIAEAEQALQAKLAELGDPAVVGDAPRLRSICEQMEDAQKTVDELYQRWAELEQKQL